VTKSCFKYEKHLFVIVQRSSAQLEAKII